MSQIMGFPISQSMYKKYTLDGHSKYRKLLNMGQCGDEIMKGALKNMTKFTTNIYYSMIPAALKAIKLIKMYVLQLGIPRL